MRTSSAKDSVAVVRGGAGEDERLGAGSEDPGELVVEGGGVDKVVTLVDDHRVPPDALEVVAVAPGVLEVSMEMITRR